MKISFLSDNFLSYQKIIAIQTYNVCLKQNRGLSYREVLPTVLYFDTELKEKEENIMFGECHAHIIMDGLNYRNAVNQHRNGVDESVIHRHLTIYQNMGITFIRDGGDALGVSKRAKEIAPCYGIDYRTPVFAIHKAGHYGGIVGKAFETMMQYHALVLQAKREGADFIKIMTTGIMDFSSDGAITGEALLAEEVKEMIHIAHEEGMSVMSHTNGARAVYEAVSAGVDSIEHGNFIDRDCIRLMAERKTIWVPTVTVVPNLIGCGRFDDAVLTKIWESEKETLQAAFNEGVLLALGSDAGAYLVYHGKGLYDELHCFQMIIPDNQLLISRLKNGEEKILERFQR